jgi:hypothetical protein
MSRRYLALFAAVIGAAGLLTVLSRLPRAAGTGGATAARTPAVSLGIEIRDARVLPATASVPKGGLVRLEVVNAEPRSVRFGLAGYEDLLPERVLAPGESWSAELRADRPGDDFAWLLDGVPSGRLAVSGSHLVEGHR